MNFCHFFSPPLLLPRVLFALLLLVVCRKNQIRECDLCIMLKNQPAPPTQLWEFSAHLEEQNIFSAKKQLPTRLNVHCLVFATYAHTR